MRPMFLSAANEEVDYVHAVDVEDDERESLTPPCFVTSAEMELAGAVEGDEVVDPEGRERLSLASAAGRARSARGWWRRSRPKQQDTHTENRSSMHCSYLLRSCRRQRMKTSLGW